jgi:hypothetical protein
MPLKILDEFIYRKDAFGSFQIELHILGACLYFRSLIAGSHSLCLLN